LEGLCSFLKRHKSLRHSRVDFRYRSFFVMIGVFFFLSTYTMPKQPRLSHQALLKRVLHLTMAFIGGFGVVYLIFFFGRGYMCLYHLWFVIILVVMDVLMHGAFRLSFYHGPVELIWTLLAFLFLFGGGLLFQVGVCDTSLLCRTQGIFRQNLWEMNLGTWTPTRLLAFGPAMIYVLFCFRRYIPWWVMVPVIVIADIAAGLGLVPFPSTGQLAVFRIFWTCSNSCLLKVPSIAD